MKIELIVCSFLPTEALSKELFLDVLINKYKGKYSDINTVQVNPNQPRGSLQPLLGVKDFLKIGLGLNVFDGKVDFLFNPQKDVNEFDESDLQESFAALGELFSHLNHKVGRISAFGIAANTVSSDEIKKRIKNISNISDDSSVEVTYKDVSRKDGLNIIKTIQAVDVQEAPAAGAQEPKNLVVSLEVNNIPTSEDKSLSDVQSQVASEFIAGLKKII